MKRKRKRRAKVFALQRVVVSVKPRYFGNDTCIQIIESMLPPLVAPIFDEFGRSCQYCGAQLQSDSGDWMFFFKTRWRTYRQRLTILSETQNNEPMIVFSCLSEDQDTDFMGRYGYDIEWDRIVEIDYQDFTDFVSQACAISIEGWIQDNSSDSGEKIGVHADMKWIPPHVRDAVLNTGRITSIEESFNFPHTTKWKEKVAHPATRKY